MWRALEQLPPAQRAVIVQRYYLGMSEAEMAGSAEIPSGTIKSRLKTARKGLKNLLRPQFRATDSSTNQEQPAPAGVLPGPLDRRNNHE